MKRLLRLSVLYLKTAFSCMGRALTFTAAILAIAALLLWNTYRNADGGLSFANIGIVSEDDSKEMDWLFRIVKSMPAVKGLCSLEKYEKNEALKELKNGNLQIVMEIPENFVTDLNYMKESSLTLYVPKGDILANDRIFAMLSSVESLMATTECAICSMYEGMEHYSYNTTVSEMEDTLFGTYINSFLNREDQISIEYLSEYGNFDSFLYYGISGILFATVLLGVFMLRGYSKNMLETEKILAYSYGGKIILSLLKILCFSVPYFVLGSTLFAAFSIIGEKLGYEIYISLPAYLTIIFIGLTISSFVHIFANLVGNREGREILYGLIVTLAWIISGATLGSNRFLVPSMSRYALLSSACDIRITGAFWGQLIYMFLFIVIAVLLSVKNIDIKFEFDSMKKKGQSSKRREHNNLYLNWFKLKLKTNIKSYVFWLETAVIVVTAVTIHFLVLKNNDSNRVIYISNGKSEEMIDYISGFDYEPVASLKNMKKEIIKGKALAGLNIDDAGITIYAPTGSYSGVILRELIYPYMLNRQSPDLLKEYLKGIGLNEDDPELRYVLDANRHLNENFKISIFKINEVLDAKQAGVNKTDAVGFALFVMITLAFILSVVYEIKSNRGFLNSRPFFVRITLVLESGIIRCLLLAVPVVLVMIII